MNLFRLIKKILTVKHIDKDEGNSVTHILKEEKFKNNLPLLKKLFPFILPYWRKGVLASALLIGASLLTLVQPLFTKYILDDIIVHKDVTKLIVTIGILLIILIAEAVLAFLKQFHFFAFEQKD